MVFQQAVDVSLQYFAPQSSFDDWLTNETFTSEEFCGFPFSSYQETHNIYPTPWEENYLFPLSMERPSAPAILQCVPEVVQSHKCSSSLTLQWCHKKGKTKPQQFWVYCEGSQQNYAKVSFLVEGINWGPKSAFMYLKNFPESIVFVENASLDEVVGVTYDSRETGPYLRKYSKSDLCPLDSSKIQLSVELVEDGSFPVHPQQGRASAVTIDKKVKQMEDPSSMISYLASFTFKNRSEGWFRLNTSLSCNGITLSVGQSDVFMFNNPRMKKLKEFRDYAPSQIKIMQVYALSDHRSSEAEHCWEATALSVGLTMPKLKSSGVLFPSPLKRKLKPQGSRSSPAKKRKL